MPSVSFLIQLFAIATFINISLETLCGSTKSSQQGPNFRSWQVSIVYSGQWDQIDPLKCSGTILNDRFVITAAHCLYDLNGDPVALSMLQIQSSNNADITRKIEKVYHPKEFNIERMDDDVVLLKLDRPFPFNSYVSPICFNPIKFTNRSEAFTTTSNILEHESESNLLNLTVLSDHECDRINNLVFNKIFENTLCLGQFEVSQTLHRKAGTALMNKVDDAMFINGIVLFTTGSSQGNISFAAAINLEPYAVWIDKVINRHRRPSVSELKCQEYSKEAIVKEETHWIPAVMLLDANFDTFKPLCFASLISDKFLITAARCKRDTRTIFIQYDIIDTEIFKEFEFHTIPAEPEGIALVKLPTKPRRFNLIISCLWVKEDTPIKFIAEIKHALRFRMEEYFRAEYIPKKGIRLERLKPCSIVSSMMISSAPGDVVAVNGNNETLRRIVGLTTKGFGECKYQSEVCIVDKLEWIEEVVWGS